MDVMKELYNKVSKDAALQEKYTAIIKDAEKAGGEATRENLIVFAKEAGYDVTIEEAQEFFKGLVEEQKGELSDAELDMVAGGKVESAIVFSIFTLGIACAVVSLETVMVRENCGEELSRRF